MANFAGTCTSDNKGLLLLLLLLLYSDNSINSPNGGLVIIIRLQNFATKWLLISCGRECLFTYRRCFE